MSKPTPETDERAGNLTSIYETCVTATFARRLERERDGLKVALEQSTAILQWYVIHYGNHADAQSQIEDNELALAALKEKP